MAGVKFGRIWRAGRKVASAPGRIASVGGVSPNPMTNLILVDLAMRGTGTLLRHFSERMVLGAKYDAKTARDLAKGRSMTQTLVSTALARVATRSVPGAVVVGGGLVVKTLYDRVKSRRDARKEGAKDIAKQARRGADAQG